jgi:hypothetical protein
MDRTAGTDAIGTGTEQTGNGQPRQRARIGPGTHVAGHSK